MEEKTFDERADEYVKSANLDPNTYKGDVQTAYVVACMEQQKIHEQTIKDLQQALSELDARTSGQIVVGGF